MSENSIIDHTYTGKLEYKLHVLQRRDRIVVSTLRCGRNNPGSNPGHGSILFRNDRS